MIAVRLAALLFTVGFALAAAVLARVALEVW